MKRFWKTWLVVVASAAAASSAHAQMDFNQPSEIGAYQFILARAGYGNVPQAQAGQAQAGVPQQAIPVPGQAGSMTSSVYQGGNPGYVGNGGIQGNGAMPYGPGVSGYGAAGATQGSGSRPGSVVVGGPGINGPIPGGPVVGGPGYVGGTTTGGYVGGYAGSFTTVGPAYTEVYDDGIYGQTGGVGRAVSTGGGSNIVLGVRSLFLQRDYEDEVRMSGNAINDNLCSICPADQTMAGLDVSLTRRNANGNGAELRFWGVFSDTTSGTITGPGVFTKLSAMSDVFLTGYGTLENYFDNATSHTLYRDNDIFNLEFNLLKNAGQFTTRRGRQGNYELLGGVRWLQFNEYLRYHADNAGANPTSADYMIDVENALIGLQLGGRGEIALTNRLGFLVATKVGLFNNHITHAQRIWDSNGNLGYRTVAGVDDYDFNSTKNDLSMLGELDFGLTYRLSCKSRAVFGYRVVGVSGIALAADQIPRNFASNTEIVLVESNGDLILGGAYGGFEFCY